ncbi:unnamed protein product [Caenorhabditis nigoni]
MDEPQRYAKNGICRFENFPECLNNLNEVDMGTTITDGISINWFMGLEIVPHSEGARFRAYIRSECAKENARITFFVILEVVSTFGHIYSRGKLTAETNGRMFTAGSRNISEIVNLPTVFLKNGALQIEYGIHLEGYHSDDGIWKFNFRDKHFSFRADHSLKVMMQSNLNPYARDSYCHREILHFHSQYVSSKFSVDDPILSDRVLPLNRRFHEHYTDVALQIAHGVRLPLSVDGCFKVAEIAEKLKLRNVSRYVERKMMEIDGECNGDYYNYWGNDTFLKIAIRYDFNHFLAHYMKTRGSTKNKFNRSDIQHMSKNAKMLTGNNQCRIS